MLRLFKARQVKDRMALSRYLARRRSLHKRIHRLNPARFLEELDLLSGVPEQDREPTPSFDYVMSETSNSDDVADFLASEPMAADHASSEFPAVLEAVLEETVPDKERRSTEVALSGAAEQVGTDEPVVSSPSAREESNEVEQQDDIAIPLPSLASSGLATTAGEPTMEGQPLVLLNSASDAAEPRIPLQVGEPGSPELNLRLTDLDSSEPETVIADTPKPSASTLPIANRVPEDASTVMPKRDLPVNRQRRKLIQEISIAEVRQSPAQEIGRPLTSASKVSTSELSARGIQGAPDTDPAELFVQRYDTSRTPAAWAARLAQSAQRPVKHPSAMKSSLSAGSPLSVGSKPRPQNLRTPEAHRDPSPLQPLPSDRPEPITESTRRFLKPLVGIDPASVPVYQGPSAAQIVRANRADAVATGETVTMGSAYVRDSREHIGLLAHELTHVARRRVPRFIPPIAREVRTPAGTTKPAERMDEEALANRVESRVRRRAGEFKDKPVATSVMPTMGVTFEPREVHNASEPSVAGSPNRSKSGGRSEGSGSPETWGGLPAPWEPLPACMTSAPEIRASTAPATSAGTSSELPNFAAAQEMSTVAPLQFAEVNRPLDEGLPATADSSQAEPAPEAQHPQPDLEAQARQVYLILKRRLAAERRRQLT